MKKVEIVFVLDETGSMQSLASDTVGGFNKFVEDQKALNADVKFSLILFSDTMGPEKKFRRHYEGVSLSDVAEMKPSDYNPHGVTPLLDAVGGTIDSLGVRLAGTPEDERPDQVIVVILTDGLENASTEYTSIQVREMVKHQREKYNWEFVFLGVGIDAFEAGKGYGFNATYTASLSHTDWGVKSAYRSATTSVSDLVEGGNDGSSIGGK